MTGMTWDEVQTAVGAAAHNGKLAGNTVFPHITTDTRKISSGDLFVALRGEKFDGADFAAEALERGAAAVIVGTPLEHICREGAEESKRHRSQSGGRTAGISGNRACMAHEV